MSVKEQLQRLERIREWVRQADRILGELSPAERLILQKLILKPEKGNAALLCQLLEMEQATVYRKRQQLLQKLQLLPKYPIGEE